MAIAATGYAHVRLTVTDIARSRAFYDDVFGFPVVYEMPPDADDATREALSFLYNGVIYQVAGGLLGLRPVAPAGDRFHEDRIGLDHVSFAVATLAEVEAAEKAQLDIPVAATDFGTHLDRTTRNRDHCQRPGPGRDSTQGHRGGGSVRTSNGSIVLTTQDSAACLIGRRGWRLAERSGGVWPRVPD